MRKWQTLVVELEDKLEIWDTLNDMYELVENEEWENMNTRVFKDKFMSNFNAIVHVLKNLGVIIQDCEEKTSTEIKTRSIPIRDIDVERYYRRYNARREAIDSLKKKER